MSLEQIWTTLKSWLQPGASPSDPRELAEIRHDILDEIRGRIQELSAGRFLFPFNHIFIELRPGSPSERAAIKMAWIDGGELQSEICAALAREDCDYPDNLVAEVRFREASRDEEVTRNFWLTFDNTSPSGVAQTAAGTRFSLTVITGEADPSSVDVVGIRTNLGRLREVFDQGGQFIRRNDLAFLEVRNGINETVGRIHAHIGMQRDGCYALINSRRNDKNPTAIIRNGQSIPVILLPVPIESGDIIQLGRATIRVT